MAFPMLENVAGEYFIYNGRSIRYDSEEGKAFFQPIDDIVYYESIRVRDGILVFFENHMVRLLRSIEAKENFPLDTDLIYETAMLYIGDPEFPVTDGNIRVVATAKGTLIHLTNAVYPTAQMFEEGVPAVTFLWEREEPGIKIFRGEYKAALAEAMERTTPAGPPYEALLADRNGKLTEGGRSNFFVLFGDDVFSPPEDKILSGITRRYVLQAIRQVGLSVQEGSFTLEQIQSMREKSVADHIPFAVFVTSSPFDILPINQIDDVPFPSSYDSAFLQVLHSYQSIVANYIASRQNQQATPDIV